MRKILQNYFIVTASIFTLTQIIPAITIQNGWFGIFYASFILALLLYIAKPIVNLIMIPINFITLNLASWLVNIIIIYLWILLVRDVQIHSWEFGGGVFGPLTFSRMNFGALQVTIIVTILLAILEKLYSWLIK